MPQKEMICKTTGAGAGRARLALLASHLAARPSNVPHASPRAAPCASSSDPAADLRERIRGIGGGTVALNLSHAPGIALLQLSQPAKRNAISGKMAAELADAVDRLESICAQGSAAEEPGRSLVAVLVAGQGNTFCAGFDLTGVPAGAGAADLRGLITALITRTLHRLRRLPLVSLAALDGYTLGGGTEIAAHMDHRVAADTTKFRFVQVRMGLATAWEGGSKVFRLLGRSRGRFMRAYGQSPLIGPEEAVAIGLADEKAAPGKTALEHGTEFLLKYARDEDGRARSVGAIRGLKELATTFDDRFVAEDEAREAEVRERLASGEESRKAFASAAVGGSVKKQV
ncbi:ClpP/crotonase-like domain-containing protein [Hyaloraphidium curvatum]|nr:ClpP/crotonase-like domain-containing protein [Hyaloraphidium curvatum]